MEDNDEKNLESLEVKQATEVTEKPTVEVKRKLDKKIIHGAGVAVVLILLALGWLLIGSDSEESGDTNSDNDQTLQNESVAPDTQYESLILVEFSDKSIHLLNTDGTTESYIAPKEGEVTFSTSPDGKYVSKVTSQGLFIASTDSENLDFLEVYSKTNEQNSISYKWYPDSSNLIVGEGVLLNPEDRVENDKWAPVTRQDFYVIKQDGSSKRELFSHQEVYGGATITGINPNSNEFYWATGGEGGPREVFIRSSLTTGEQIDKSENIGSINNAVGTTKVYTEESSDSGGNFKSTSVVAYNFDGTQDSIIFTSPEYDSLKALTENCSEGSSLNDLFVSKLNESLYFSLIDAPEQLTTIYKFTQDNSDVMEIYSDQTARELNVLYGDESQVVYSKGFVAHCNDLGETNPINDKEYEYYILENGSDTPTQIVNNGLRIRQVRQIQLPI